MKKEQGNEVTSSLQNDFLEMIEVLKQPLPHGNGIGRHVKVSLSNLSEGELEHLAHTDTVSSTEAPTEQTEEPEDTEELVSKRKHLILQSLPCLEKPIDKVVIICTLDGNSDHEIAKKVKLPIDEVRRIRRHAAVHLAQALNPSTIH